MNFGENLTRICKEKGTNPTALCKELGWSTSKVSAWNKGSIPKQENLMKLAEALNCSVMDFFFDEEDEVTEVEAPDLMILRPRINSSLPTSVTARALPPTLDEDEYDIVTIFRSMKREDKHKLLARLYAYLEGENI